MRVHARMLAATVLALLSAGAAIAQNEKTVISQLTGRTASGYVWAADMTTYMANGSFWAVGLPDGSEGFDVYWQVSQFGFPLAAIHGFASASAVTATPDGLEINFDPAQMRIDFVMGDPGTWTGVLKPSTGLGSDEMQQTGRYRWRMVGGWPGGTIVFQSTLTGNVRETSAVFEGKMGSLDVSVVGGASYTGYARLRTHSGGELQVIYGLPPGP